MPSSEDLKVNAIAGAISGLVELSFMYPMDLVKTRMQGIKPKSTATYSSVLDSFKTITRNEGVRRLYRGMPMPLVTVLPANAVYFVSYDLFSKGLSVKENVQRDYMAQGVAGSLATIARTTLINPAEVVKQRMQMYKSPYRSSLHCLQTVFQKEGLWAFYRSYPAQVAIDIPFGAIYFVVYSLCQKMRDANDPFNAVAHCVCGAVSGGAAAAVTAPIDVCRTLVNTQESATLVFLDKSRIKGLTHAFFVVYRVHGLKGFKRGLAARIVYYMPSAGFSILTYEFMKYSMVD
ncbi:hypothetical protein JTE90_025337 [Oedothorax gibbosus]|uniref:Mitochondrial carrier protein n=1 Tax=Oedothorax gibbosus TaxID=931172 RepID=A0AAV6V874_9ARAC|nr:hypothetical protein JTE90_025337 [Oedothorax gibbosus]